MFLAKIVFTAFTCATLTNYVIAETEEEESLEELEDQQQEEEETPSTPLDSHTYVALIDIVFTNGVKRTCTGTIIHDNVVITAAHCFVNKKKHIQPELTASFVVIGTMRMFETGYENYLPIERVVTHPKFKGWTADVALVYTFAGMTSDKPGNVISLVGENTMTPVDSNVTILSWGHCKDEALMQTQAPGAGNGGMKRICTSSEDENCEQITSTRSVPYGSQNSGESESQTGSIGRPLGRQGPEITKTHKRHSKTTTLHDKKTAIIDRLAQFDISPEEKVLTTKIASLYLTSSEIREKKTEKKKLRKTKTTPKKRRYHKAQRNDTDNGDIMVMIDTDEGLKVKINVEPTSRHPKYKGAIKKKDKLMVEQGRNRAYYMEKEITKASKNTTNNKQTKQNKNKSRFKNSNWRRQLGTKENRLTVEIFGFVNIQTCKKIVDKTLPSVYSINPNYFVCYASEEHYINEEDSGAPAIRQGQLVAVTLGGVECEGDHVAIGIKMSCLCSWISGNLPNEGGKDWKCCKNCCSGNNQENAKSKQKNKYLYK